MGIWSSLTFNFLHKINIHLSMFSILMINEILKHINDTNVIIIIFDSCEI